MKALKLLLIVIVMAGAVAAIFMFSRPDSVTPDIESVSPDDYKEIEGYINQFKAQGEWNKAGYRNIMDRINSTCPNSVELKTSLNLASLKIIDSIIMKQYSQRDCTPSAINPLYKNLSEYRNLAKQYGGAEDFSESKIEKLDGIKELYKNVVEFVKSSYYLNPRFDISQNTWKLYVNYYESLLSTKARYENNEYYQYIRNISSIDSGMNRDFFTKTEKNRAEYPTTVLESIKTAYKNVDKTPTNYLKLKDAIVKLKDTYEKRANGSVFLQYNSITDIKQSHRVYRDFEGQVRSIYEQKINAIKQSYYYDEITRSEALSQINEINNELSNAGIDPISVYLYE